MPRRIGLFTALPRPLHRVFTAIPSHFHRLLWIRAKRERRAARKTRRLSHQVFHFPHTSLYPAVDSFRQLSFSSHVYHEDSTGKKAQKARNCNEKDSFPIFHRPYYYGENRTIVFLFILRFLLFSPARQAASFSVLLYADSGCSRTDRPEKFLRKGFRFYEHRLRSTVAD